METTTYRSMSESYFAAESSKVSRHSGAIKPTYDKIKQK